MNDGPHFGTFRRKDRAYVRDYGRPIRRGQTREQAQQSADWYNSPTSVMMRRMMRESFAAVAPGIIKSILDGPKMFQNIPYTGGSVQPLRIRMPDNWKVTQV